MVAHIQKAPWVLEGVFGDFNPSIAVVHCTDSLNVWVLASVVDSFG